ERARPSYSLLRKRIFALPLAAIRSGVSMLRFFATIAHHLRDRHRLRPLLHAVGPRRAATTRRFRCRHASLDRRLHLEEGAHLDLAHALRQKAKLNSELIERRRIVGKTSRFEDKAVAVFQHGQRLVQCVPPRLLLFALRQGGLLAGTLIDQPVLPLAGI